MTEVRAIIADDEQPSRLHIKTRLSEVWPGLTICGEAANGIEALELIEKLRPDVAFLDIKMPGLSGMQVAQRAAGICQAVFITAYDHYAVRAFENEAIDYILKPVSRERLRKTAARIQVRLSETHSRNDFTQALERVIQGLQQASEPQFLKWIRVQIDASIRLIPVDEIYFFQSRSKYTAVVTREMEALIRKPIRELAEELDPGTFLRIHRSTIVNAKYVAKVDVSPAGRSFLKLKGRSEIHSVSRSYTHLFKQM